MDDSTSGLSATGRRGSDFADLSRTIKAAGLLARRPGSYAVRGVLVAAGWAGAWTAFVLVGPSWWQLGVAAVLAVAVTQVAFLGHDAGHRQIFASRRANDLLGLVCANLVVGVSYSWWVDKHTRHHTHPNHVDADPDVADGAIAFTRAQARARTSPIGRWFARHQAAAFFPMLLGEGLSLHAASVQSLWHRRTDRTRVIEVVLLAVHTGAYLAAVFLVLPPLQAVAFIAVHQGLFGVYMGCSFAPTHKGMPLIGEDTTAEELDFLRRQVLTSRNISGGRGVQVLLGGLNFQIEHHLFPSMPSANLRLARPLVQDFCRDHGVPYAETTLVESYVEVLRYLHNTGAPETAPETTPETTRAPR